jgi:hypothetical protein
MSSPFSFAVAIGLAQTVNAYFLGSRSTLQLGLLIYRFRCKRSQDLRLAQPSARPEIQSTNPDKGLNA